MSCLRIAFTFGNISDTKPEAETIAGSADYDGTISAILTFVVTVVMATALSIASVASPQFDDVICLLTLVTYMLIGLSVMSVFAVNRRRFLLSPVMHDSRRDTLTLAGIAMFFVLASLLDIFHVISYVKCDAVFRACVDRYTYVAYVIVVVYHVVRIAYLGGETFLCISFKRSLFRRTVCTRYGIAFMQAVNVSLWFDAFVHESSNRFNSPLYHDDFGSRCRSGNLSNLTRHELSCMNQNGTMNALIEEKLSPVFLPFLLQFALFVGESFSRWYFHSGTPSTRRVVDHTDHEDHTDRSASEMAAIATQHDLRGRSTCEYDVDPTSDPKNSPVEEYDPDNSAFDNSLSFSFTDSEDSLVEQEETPFTEETVQASSSSSSSSDSSTSVRLSLACLTIFLVASLTVFVAIVYKKYAPGVVPSKYRRLLAYYTCCQSVCMLAAVVAGYLASSKFKVSRRMPFAVLDYLVLLTSCGPFLVRFLSIIAITEFRPISSVNATSDDNNFPISSPGVYLVAGELVCAVEVYFQVVFNLFAARVKVARQDTCLTATVFRLAVTYLAVANLVAWMLTCSTSVPTEFEVFGGYFSNDDWLSITKVTLLFPLSTFFRFVSSLQFLKTLQRLLTEEVA